MILLKFLFIVICAYYLLKIVFRSLFPYLLERYLNKLNQKLGNEVNEYYQQQQTSNKGVTINYIPKEKKSESKDKGEYVDYEEVKE